MRTKAQHANANADGPLQLIRAESDGRLSVCEDAAARIQALPGEFGVCVVGGAYRTGKSFLLNQLTERGGASGFRVGSSVNACTKGIWMWGSPVQLTPNAPPVLFLDTEGLSSTVADEQHDAKIFSLAVLLGSMFVYNGEKVVNNAAIDSLSLVANLTERIRTAASSDGEPTRADDSQGGGSDDTAAASLAAELPDFVWLLRDAFLAFEDDSGRPISPPEYLERSLQPQPGKGAAAAERNATRAAIARLFRSRTLHALPHPTVGTAVAEGELSTLPDLSRVNPAFRDALGALRTHIAGAIRPKAVCGTTLTGGAYVQLARAYVSAINDGAVPTIRSAWAAVASAECETAARAAVEAYAASLRAALDADPSASEASVERAHASALSVAVAAFRARAVGAPGLVAEHEGRVREAAETEKGRQLELLSARSSAACELALSRAREALRAAAATVSSVPSAADGARACAHEAQTVAAALATGARGPARDGALVAFACDVLPGWASELVGAAGARTEAAQAELAAARSQAEKARARADEATARATAAAKESADALAEARARASGAQARAEASSAELAAARTQADAARARADEAAARATAADKETAVALAEASARASGAEARAEQLQRRVADAEAAAERARTSGREDEARAHASAVSAQRAADAARAEVAAIAERAASAEARMAAADADARAANESLGAQAAELTRVRADAAASSAECATLRAQLAALSEELTRARQARAAAPAAPAIPSPLRELAADQPGAAAPAAGTKRRRTETSAGALVEPAYEPELPPLPPAEGEAEASTTACAPLPSAAVMQARLKKAGLTAKAIPRKRAELEVLYRQHCH